MKIKLFDNHECDVSREEYRKLLDRVTNLEKIVTVQYGEPKLVETKLRDSQGYEMPYIYREKNIVTLKELIELILKHFNLKITSISPREEQIILIEDEENPLA